MVCAMPVRISRNGIELKGFNSKNIKAWVETTKHKTEYTQAK
jgi:hypothetical protein